MLEKLRGLIPKFEQSYTEEIIQIERTCSLEEAQIAWKKDRNFEYYFYLGHSYSFLDKNEMSIIYYDSAIQINDKKDIIIFVEAKTKEINKRLKKRFNIKISGIDYDAKYIFSEAGYNFLPSEISAAFALEQLKKLKNNLKKKSGLTN